MISPKAVLVGIIITTILGLFHVFLGMPYIWVILFILVYLFSGPLVYYIAFGLIFEILLEGLTVFNLFASFLLVLWLVFEIIKEIKKYDSRPNI
jgi:hypothetical protein